MEFVFSRKMKRNFNLFRENRNLFPFVLTYKTLELWQNFCALNSVAGQIYVTFVLNSLSFTFANNGWTMISANFEKLTIYSEPACPTDALQKIGFVRSFACFYTSLWTFIKRVLPRSIPYKTRNLRYYNNNR